jgi:hypothetical protein
VRVRIKVLTSQHVNDDSEMESDNGMSEAADNLYPEPRSVNRS